MAELKQLKGNLVLHTELSSFSGLSRPQIREGEGVLLQSLCKGWGLK